MAHFDPSWPLEEPERVPGVSTIAGILAGVIVIALAAAVVLPALAVRGWAGRRRQPK